MLTQVRPSLAELDDYPPGGSPSPELRCCMHEALPQRSWEPPVARAGVLAVAFGLAALVGCQASEAGSDNKVIAMTTAGMSAMEGTSTGESSGTVADTVGAQPCDVNEDCDDGNLCNGAEVCAPAGVCEAGTPPEGRPQCGDGMLCVDGECVAAVCGNGQLETGEHCDDGNTATFDGCDQSCRYELFYRMYEVTALPSPAASFCSRPTSAVGDSMSEFVLGAHNAGTQDDIDIGVRNSLFQLLDLDDMSGQSDETIEFRMVGAVTDPARGTWPADGSNPIDWWFLANPWDLAPDGGIGIRVADTALQGGTFIGGPSTILSEAHDLLDVSVRAHFSDTLDPNVPAGPPESLAPGLQVPQEIIGEGDDEGICGTITVSYFASQPLSSGLADCLDCPGRSRTYNPCEGEMLTETCNSALDVVVGGCVLGPSCDAGIEIIFPSQPDVDHGGIAVLTNDPANLNKIPTAQTDGNLNGYSYYYHFRARRVHITGINE